MTRSPSSKQGRAVAVVGLAGRFPGADSPDRLWEVLRDGVDATSAPPPERAPGPTERTGVRRAGYLDDVAGFDAEFFGMSPIEASELDPQQRLLLMAGWEALEDAGLLPEDVAGSRTAVFVGCAKSDYLDLQRGSELVGPALMNSYRALLAGRLSHAFDLRGPSVLVDTACSSSLVAVHQAVQSLRAGEVPLAVAAGVSLTLTEDEPGLMERAGNLAHDGRSKFADASADGYGPSDGAGVVVLKRLADAEAAGDRIRAVIEGSAVSNDGASGALLTPALAGQVEVMRWALDDAGVGPDHVDFVEAHGSGVPDHDGVELAALGAVLAQNRDVGHRVPVGSVKTNLGHAQGAAGIIGLIKAVLCLEHGQLPPSLGFRTPSPQVAWEDLPITIPTTLSALSAPGRPLRAGVSAQGLSTLNAHVVVRQGRAGARERHAPADDGAAQILVLTARTSAALHDLVRAYVEYLAPGGHGTAYALRDICYTAGARRQRHQHRLVVQGTSHAELREALEHGDYRAVPAPREMFRDGRIVSLPGYPWQTERYWLGERPAGAPEADAADALLRQHSRTDYTEDSRLSDLGIDSLALLRIIVELGQEQGYDVDAADIAALRTVSAFRAWLRGLEVAA